MKFHKFKLRHSQIVALCMAVYDFVMVIAAYGLALWIRFDCQYQQIPRGYFLPYLQNICFHALICVILYWLCYLYNSIWRFASYNELIRITIAVSLTVAIHSIYMNVFVVRMPISYFVFGCVIQYVFTLGIRFGYRFILLFSYGKNNRTENCARVMIVGAGAAGQLIMRDISRTVEVKERVCCFIDDNPNKWRRSLDGIPVVGGRERILEACKNYKIDKIYVTIPSAARKEKREILNICKESGCELKDLPEMYHLYTGNLSVSNMRNVTMEDLLGRDPISVNLDEIFESLHGKTILVTGGGGSIGSELCRQIASHQPGRLVIFDIYENNAYDIQMELLHDHPELAVNVEIGSVRDSRRLFKLFEDYRPEIVYHAAAHKHVPLMEDSPCEAIKNNTIGTYKTAYAAMAHGCKRFVLISTDKAVNPSNVMGASKRLCEMVIQAFDHMVKAGRAADIPQLFTHPVPAAQTASASPGAYSTREQSEVRATEGHSAQAYARQPLPAASTMDPASFRKLSASAEQMPPLPLQYAPQPAGCLREAQEETEWRIHPLKDMEPYPEGQAVQCHVQGCSEVQTNATTRESMDSQKLTAIQKPAGSEGLTDTRDFPAPAPTNAREAAGPREQANSRTGGRTATPESAAPKEQRNSRAAAETDTKTSAEIVTETAAETKIAVEIAAGTAAETKTATAAGTITETVAETVPSEAAAWKDPAGPRESTVPRRLTDTPEYAPLQEPAQLQEPDGNRDTDLPHGYTDYGHTDLKAALKHASTEFVAVRFGNVLGSNGSVIPLFQKQIEAGGPVTVTHPDIVRYFMTIPEAVGLVLQAGVYAHGGEIFVLDMGEPVKIDTLARNLIFLSGYQPGVDIQIVYSGLRPGEKLYEEKLLAEEGLKKTQNDLIFIGCPVPFDTTAFLDGLKDLMDAAYKNKSDIRDLVKRWVPNFKLENMKHVDEEKLDGRDASEVEKEDRKGMADKGKPMNNEDGMGMDSDTKCAECRRNGTTAWATCGK